MLLNQQLNIAVTLPLLLLAATQLTVTAAPAPLPAKLDANESPFALELQPPLLDAPTIDSYGNPIETLKPIDTPDGRKVVSAQGLQFEIPNYASGITEIRKPADDLLPPHIDSLAAATSRGQQPKPFQRPLTTATTTTTAAPIIEQNPFDSATVPPWLLDFDYPGVGPGVSYNPDNFKDPDSNSNTATHLEPQNASTPPPRGVHEEQFPPFQQATPTGDPTITKKIEYTKSEEGKVITTPVSTGFTEQRKDTATNGLFNSLSDSDSSSAFAQSTASSAFGSAPTRSSAIDSTPPSSSNSGKYTGGFGAPPGLLRPQNAAKTDIYVAGKEHEFKANKARPTVNPGRYTGGFGAPSGVLAPEGTQQVPRPFQQQQPQQGQHVPSASAPSASFAVNYQSRFGGPPGILVPFDNVQVQRAAQQ